MLLATVRRTFTSRASCDSKQRRVMARRNAVEDTAVSSSSLILSDWLYMEFPPVTSTIAGHLTPLA